MKAKLGSGRRVTLDTTRPNGGPGLGSDAPMIQTGEMKEPVHRRASRLIIGVSLLTVGVIVAVYLILASTIMFIAPGNVNHAVVLRGAYSIGSVPPGSYVYVSAAPAQYGFTDKLSQAFEGVPGAAVVQIIGGPNGVVSTKNGEVFINGKDTGYKGDATKRMLANTYVARCMVGSCKANDTVLIPQDNIVGGVKGYASLTGIRPASNP